MSLDAEKAYTFRAYIPEDINFISNSWGSSYYKGMRYNLTMSPEEFHNDYHRKHRENLFANPRASIIVCCGSKDFNLILGWIAFEKPKKSEGMILHYIYVKQAFKGNGIAKELVGKALLKGPISYTHATERAWRIIDSCKDDRFKDWYYRPHIF